MRSVMNACGYSLPGCHGNFAASTRPVENFSSSIDPQLNGGALCNNYGRTYFDEFMPTCLRGASFLRHSVEVQLIERSFLSFSLYSPHIVYTAANVPELVYSVHIWLIYYFFMWNNQNIQIYLRFANAVTDWARLGKLAIFKHWKFLFRNSVYRIHVVKQSRDLNFHREKGRALFFLFRASSITTTMTTISDVAIVWWQLRSTAHISVARDLPRRRRISDYINVQQISGSSAPRRHAQTFRKWQRTVQLITEKRREWFDRLRPRTRRCVCVCVCVCVWLCRRRIGAVN